MPRQIADDSGRQFRKIYLGAKNARWAWDWTYDEWIVAFLAFAIGGTLITWVIPAGLLVAGMTWWFARKIGARGKRLRVLCLLVAGLCLIISWNPMTWLTPLPLPFALLLSLLLPRLGARLAHVVDWNRPLAYWLRLPRIVASGPRRPEPESFSASPLMLGMTLEELDTETGDIAPRPIDSAVAQTLTHHASQPVEATVIKPSRVAKVDPAERRLVPTDKGQHSTKFIARTERGIRIGNTEYRLEDRY